MIICRDKNISYLFLVGIKTHFVIANVGVQVSTKVTLSVEMSHIATIFNFDKLLVHITDSHH